VPRGHRQFEFVSILFHQLAGTMFPSQHVWLFTIGVVVAFLAFTTTQHVVVHAFEVQLVRPLALSQRPAERRTTTTMTTTLYLTDQQQQPQLQPQTEQRPKQISNARRRCLSALLWCPAVRSLAIAPAAATNAAPSLASVVDSSSTGITLPKVANPFVQLETVGMVPKSYFDDNIAIYAFVERILDGDTLRVRHVPGFSLTQQTPEPLTKRGIADDTLVIRLYGIDCPEIAKNAKQTTQPFGLEAKQFASNLVYHQMVKITFIRKDRYGRAIAMVETLPATGSFLLSGLPGLGPKDLTVELARAGLAELYTGGGSEYYVRVVKKKGAVARLFVPPMVCCFARTD
jgi:endonuclease YncB( thermonuclease family)